MPEIHLVAVTVFVTAPGRDVGDARNTAERAVAEALPRGPLRRPGPAGDRLVHVHAVQEVGRAAANGRIVVQPAPTITKEVV
jgi:hypothetical protein